MASLGGGDEKGGLTTFGETHSRVGSKGVGRVVLLAFFGAILPLSRMEAAHAATPLTIVAGWHMEETSGQMIDSFGDHDGTVTNVDRGVSGITGNAYSFRGASSGSKVIVADSSAFDIGTGKFTIAAWVQFSQTPAETGQDSFDIIRKGATGSQYWKMELSTDLAKLTCHFTGSQGTVTKTAGPPLSDNMWHQIRCQKRATSVRLIVDRVVVATVNTTVGSVNNSSQVVLGQKGDGTDVFDGKMDEVGIAAG
jgi:hypothetical protein